MTDARLFEAFVRRYQDMVFATAVRMLGSHADAEDVAQTVFLRAFQRFARIGSSPAAAGWLKAVTRNECLNHLSRYRARWRFFSELSDARSDDPVPALADARAGSFRSALDDAARHRALEEAIRQLPEHQRVPLVLFHFEELSYQEIADTLHVSLGKVKTDIHRAREALRTVLSADDATR
ncbi:MAG TPA: sigma-70 family RNA polymerase sigma factor [Vicinamibacterales bacterium]|nr:sigma-70 family RNA polymerase sigma factor [Vicinamibacterales bacterium]